MDVHDAAFVELSVADLHDILELRAMVFVVEQRCAYLDIDGRDREPATRHMSFTEGGRTIAYLRVLDEGSARRIGRVVTHPDHRGHRHAERLVRHAIATCPGPWVLDAQSHLTDWYGRLGFTVAGEEFLEDGIPHVPMRRDATPS